MTYPPAYPHQPIEQIADDVFMARGSLRMNAFIRGSRNMAIVREGKDLTLINPVRLSEKELERLDALGNVKHIMRLGGHGMDDPFYKDRYNAETWRQPGITDHVEPAIDHEMNEESELPFGNASLLFFREAIRPQSVLLLHIGNGLLLTCDSIQHYGDYSMCSLAARIMMPRMGFPKATIIGPMWLKATTPEGSSLHGDFKRLLELKFDSLLSGHGTFRATGAHGAVAKQVVEIFET